MVKEHLSQFDKMIPVYCVNFIMCNALLQYNLVTAKRWENVKLPLKMCTFKINKIKRPNQ